MPTHEPFIEIRCIDEIVNGHAHTSPLPSGPYGRAMGQVLRRIAYAFDRDEEGAQDWWIALEPEVHLKSDVLVPDVCGWRRERVPYYESGPAWLVAPEWVCEVLSPFTAEFDRAHKLPAYAHHGVEWAWLVDPAFQSLEIYRRQGDAWLLVATHDGDEVIRAQPFETIDFPLGSLWLTPPSA